MPGSVPEKKMQFLVWYPVFGLGGPRVSLHSRLKDWPFLFKTVSPHQKLRRFYQNTCTLAFRFPAIYDAFLCPSTVLLFVARSCLLLIVIKHNILPGKTCSISRVCSNTGNIWKSKKFC